MACPWECACDSRGAGFDVCPNGLGEYGLAMGFVNGCPEINVPTIGTENCENLRWFEFVTVCWVVRSKYVSNECKCKTVMFHNDCYVDGAHQSGTMTVFQRAVDTCNRFDGQRPKLQIMQPDLNVAHMGVNVENVHANENGSLHLLGWHHHCCEFGQATRRTFFTDIVGGNPPSFGSIT